MPESVRAPMPMRVLGRSGIRVSDLCLGTMTFGTEWGFGTDESTSRKIYETYREAGGNYVDTANNYTDGASEEILGRVVASERDSVVLSTKYTFPTVKDDPNTGGNHRKSLRRSVETSLRRLGTDYIDVLWVHAWDQCTPVDETLRALDDMVRSGKVLAIGVSNTPAWVVSRSVAIAELRGWSSYCTMQVEYSLAARTPERELLPMADASGLAVTAWSPLGRGILARTPSTDGFTKLSAPVQRILRTTREVGDELGVSSARVALAWVLRQGLMLSIGARTLDQINDNLGALDVELDESQLSRLDEASNIRLGYPHEFLHERRALFTPQALGTRDSDAAARAGG
ncbi:aldo/keto reductase [Rhodococcus chondri]|uniref:Aldo/keto reductase n=1 Tax=Rhodococcus chondri TaxID=3065941 RepID=A0ABU7JKY2_9NOCA|nr:aldo/keto reductase [Rhodococcus sp. CC-R104]MEE2030692.1 aldo/keto reductase [Rhodococcus sp. CC-R104]